MTRSTVDEQSMLLVHAYLDGELDPANALALETRMANDPALAAERDRIEALRAVVRERLPREPLPPGLRARIEASVGARRAPPQFSWRALAASIALTAVVAGASTSVLLSPNTADNMGRDAVVAGHIRSLMAPQPFDVASSDKHTVKPWFYGKISEAPRVVDLAKADFPLAGGRLDVVGQTVVPTLVYRHAKHLVSLTAMPAPGRGGSAPVLGKAGGYNTLSWTEDEVTYWAISDIEPADLKTFADLFRTTPTDR
jgi:anti-sigma factor RsiW